MRIVIPVVYFLLAGAFVASLLLTPYRGSFIVKALPILFLFFLAVRPAGYPGKIALCAAMLFSAAGDAILDLNFPGAFIAGLGSFLVAHIWYIVLFQRDFSFSRIRWLPTVPAILYPVAMGIFLWPYLGALKIPVVIYIAVIATMLVLALNRTSQNIAVIAGAIFFVLSDSILALNKFYAPHPAGHYAIMVTYYLAQYVIVIGVLDERKAA